MNHTKVKRINLLTLALGIALLPPIWAVISPYLGITTGAVALICAGVYVTNGNKRSDGLSISVGFLCGDIWAVTALAIMKQMKFNEDLELFLTLFLLGAVAVIIANLMPRFIFLPAWLCGWAIGLTIMAPAENIGTLPYQIGAAMLVGVWYVGAGVDIFQKLVSGWILKKSDKEGYREDK
ncbi:MAG: putative rane protein [Anaerocolumna sp.]|jgi:hypothetical protein|nr:putative rane protein [Anaerocolumna sp.]